MRAGVTAVTVVELSTLTLVAAIPPKVTVVAPVKPVPVKVTPVPPEAAPDVGTMDVNVGVVEMEMLALTALVFVP